MASLQRLMELIGMYEFVPTPEVVKIFERLVCADGAITQPLCSNMLFLIAGFNKQQFNTSLLPIVLEHVPAGASTKQIMHYAQLITTGEHSFPLIYLALYFHKICTISYLHIFIVVPFYKHFLNVYKINRYTIYINFL